MAKFRIEYTYYIGDTVEFEVDFIHHQGTIQSLREIPDVWVECLEKNEHKRYRLGINSVKLLHSEHDDAGVCSYAEFEKGEKLEFVH